MLFVERDWTRRAVYGPSSVVAAQLQEWPRSRWPACHDEPVEPRAARDLVKCRVRVHSPRSRAAAPAPGWVPTVPRRQTAAGRRGSFSRARGRRAGHTRRAGGHARTPHSGQPGTARGVGLAAHVWGGAPRVAGSLVRSLKRMFRMKNARPGLPRSCPICAACSSLLPATPP